MTWRKSVTPEVGTTTRCFKDELLLEVCLMGVPSKQHLWFSGRLPAVVTRQRGIYFDFGPQTLFSLHLYFSFSVEPLKYFYGLCGSGWKMTLTALKSHIRWLLAISQPTSSLYIICHDLLQRLLSKVTSTINTHFKLYKLAPALYRG